MQGHRWLLGPSRTQHRPRNRREEVDCTLVIELKMDIAVDFIVSRKHIFCGTDAQASIFDHV